MLGASTRKEMAVEGNPIGAREAKSQAGLASVHYQSTTLVRTSRLLSSLPLTPSSRACALHEHVLAFSANLSSSRSSSTGRPSE